MKTSAVNADWLDLEPLGTGGPVLSFQRVPEGKKAKNRLHLDLDVPDVRAAGERAARLGATPRRRPYGRPGLSLPGVARPRGQRVLLLHRLMTAGRRRGGGRPPPAPPPRPRSRTRSAGTGPGPRRGRRAVPR
ncbi:hypothetical protein LUX73_08095 [Actinomadura madurae]|nr:hypothetical protein [Actinomadura madurae]